MAAPTNVRVESNGLTVTTIRWTYAGANFINVYRSTNGISFSAITSAALGNHIPVGTTSFIDTTVAVGTRYWYKLTDDLGSSFSSVVTVVTQSCLPPAGSLDTFSLPRLNVNHGDPVEEFNELSARIENVLGGRVLAPDDCIACPTNGALVLNCAGHCRQWIVVADEDINSISMQYCDEGEGNIEFIIPPNVTRKIDGWPAGLGFSGDEGFQAPIAGGTNGRTITVPTTPTGGKGKPTSSRPGTGSGIGSGGGTGAGGCNCVAVGGNLTIKSCTANNSLSCATSKSLKLIACGGRAPYVWTHTGTVVLSQSTGPTTTVTPPPNPGSGVAGNAYTLAAGQINAACVQAALVFNVYGCNDAVIAPECRGTPPACAGGTASCRDAGCASSTLPICNLPDYCPGGVLSVDKAFCTDERTGPMIAAGCVPCGLSAGATVTVTDSLGTQATIILRA